MTHVTNKQTPCFPFQLYSSSMGGGGGGGGMGAIDMLIFNLQTSLALGEGGGGGERMGCYMDKLLFNRQDCPFHQEHMHFDPTRLVIEQLKHTASTIMIISP